MKRYRHIRACVANERGSAFIIVLLLVLILSVLGLSILGMASSNMQMGDVDRDYQSVFYIAESGIDYEVKGLNDVAEDTVEDVDSANEFFTAMNTYFSDTSNYPKDITVFNDQFGETVKATVRVEGMDEWTAGTKTHTYTLISEGSIGGVKRQVASDIELTYTEGGSPDYYTYDMALFSMENITLEGSASIQGSAGTNSTQPGSINFGSSTRITDDLYISPNADPSRLFTFGNNRDIDDHVDHLLFLEEEREYPIPEYPEIPFPTQRDSIELKWDYKDITIDEDGQYDSIKTNSYTLNIDVSNGDRTLVVDTFTINSGTVNVIGDGTLYLYVTNKFDLNGSGMFNPNGDDRNVMLYYSGSNTFEVAGSCKMKGCLYSKQADINITASGGVTGHIITRGNNVNVTGNSSAYVRVIYAPNAFVNIAGSSSVSGAVIAKRCRISGGVGSYIKFDPSATLEDAPGLGSGSSPPQIEVDMDTPLELDYLIE